MPNLINKVILFQEEEKYNSKSKTTFLKRLIDVKHLPALRAVDSAAGFSGLIASDL